MVTIMDAENKMNQRKAYINIVPLLMISICSNVAPTRISKSYSSVFGFSALKWKSPRSYNKAKDFRGLFCEASRNTEYINLCEKGE